MGDYKYKPIKDVKEEVMKMIKEFPDFPKDVEIWTTQITVDKEGKQYLLITFVKNDILDVFFHEIIDSLENTIKMALEYIKDVEEDVEEE
jgi:hypothetical protein